MALLWTRRIGFLSGLVLQARREVLLLAGHLRGVLVGLGVASSRSIARMSHGFFFDLRKSRSD
jgi:hypothetical protein